jgi:GAF domain-containing protein
MMNDDQQTTASLTAEHFLALIRVGTALHAELDESRLLHLIVQTACDLTGAAFAAFSLRPVNGEGQPLVPFEERFFRLAAVVGVTAEQENLFRHMSWGGEGLLAPIFRQGVPVLVDLLCTLAPANVDSHHWQPEDFYFSQEVVFNDTYNWDRRDWNGLDGRSA